MTPWPCILIVENKDDQVAQMRERLRKSYPRSFVGCVSTGEQALSIDLSRFHIILLGYHLPDCTGIELVRRLVPVVTVPIVMVTGLRSKDAAASAINSGAADYIVKTDDYLDALPVVLGKNLIMASLWSNLKNLQEELRQRCEELREKNEELEARNTQLREVALRDPLTGLYNRRYVNEAIEQMVARAMRYDEDLTCMMIDMDKFKHVNDELGHLVGDRLLQLAGEAMTMSVRGSDITARFGGDEFVVLLPRTPFADAFACAERIIEKFGQLVAAQVPAASNVTLSIGISSVDPGKCRTVRQLIDAADESMYTSKATGHGGVFPRLNPAA